MALNPDTERPWAYLGTGAKLKKWREGKGLNQSDGARELGLDLAKLNSFENGRGRPCLDTAFELERRTGGVVRAAMWTRTPVFVGRRKAA